MSRPVDITDACCDGIMVLTGIAGIVCTIAFHMTGWATLMFVALFVANGWSLYTDIKAIREERRSWR